LSPFRHRLLVTLLAVVTVVVPLGAIAGTTGKVTGRVADARGNPLAAVNVILIGVRLGAVTDDTGTYVILNVPPGTYSLKASLIGHVVVTVTGVVVSADRTTRHDLMLREEAVGLEEVVVTARRPVVESDLTSTRYTVRSEEIEKLPVQELQEVVNLQAGVVDGHIRGGRIGEVQYQVDGVSINNAYDNSAGLKIDRSLIEEVQVISGTFDAEYGQALSGVVNAVLKTGGESFQWNAEGYTGDFLFGSDSRPVAGDFRPLGTYQLVGSLSGPLPLRATTFVLSGRRYSFDDYVRATRLFRPTDRPPQTGVASGDLGTEALGFAREWSGLVKLTNKSWPSVTMSYEALFNSIRRRNVAFAWRFNPDGLPIQRTRNVVHGLDWTQRLSKNTFYTVAARQNVVDYTDWVYEDAFDPLYDAAGPPESSNEFGFGAIYQGVSLARFEQNTNALVLKGSLSSQAHRYHLVKVGGELMRPRIRFGAPTTIVAAIDPETNREVLVRHGHEPPLFAGVQSYHPVFAAAFAQDQIEWRDLTVRAGLRGEFFDAKAAVPSDLANPANAIAGAPLSRPVDTSNKMSIAPRLGVSYPVGARAAVFFSYGHFYQLPGLHLMFENANYDVLAELQAGGADYAVLGNPDLKPERTILYEFGYKHAVTPDFGVDLTVFYKDIRDLLGVEFVSTYAASEYARFTNADFGNVLGLTLAMDQRAVGPFSATLDYTWQMAEGNTSDPRETATRAEAGEDPRPRLVPLNWDQRHTVNVTLTLAQPRIYTASAIVRAVSGQPFTPSIVSGFGGGLEANSGRKPNAVLVDLRAESALPRVRNVNLFARVFNMFDTRIFNGFVFADTGSPDYTLEPEVRRATLADPTRYYQPRRIEIGLSASGVLGGGGSSR
jgi:outer membrane receptor protein involved in Fe transport